MILKYQGWQSGQMHESVKLAPHGYEGSNPSPWTRHHAAPGFALDNVGICNLAYNLQLLPQSGAEWYLARKTMTFYMSTFFSIDIKTIFILVTQPI